MSNKRVIPNQRGRDEGRRRVAEREREGSREREREWQVELAGAAVPVRDQSG